MSDQRIITVKKGEEYFARIEDIYEKNIFFSHIYRRAAVSLNEILQFVKNKEQNLENCNSIVSLQKHLLQRSSNVIAFCADRGGGKTTALRSFANALENIDTIKKENLEFWENSNVPEYSYFVVNSIDPTAMEDHDSILKIILSRMFEQFKVYYDKVSNSCSYADRREKERDDIVILFQRCFHNLNVMASTKESFEDVDELEQIVELGDSSNFRCTLYNLIDKYLKFLYPNKKSCLVIPIDDADLNVNKAYSILEEVRKYLKLPKVIVLLAANILQMECTVEQTFIKKYETALRVNGSMINVERCHVIAEKYLEKVIPNSHRIYLPDLNKVINEAYNNISINYQEQTTEYDLSFKNYFEDVKNWSYQKQLLYFLHKKTGMIFLASKNYLHNFLPSNMRELTHFLAFFGTLKDVAIEYGDIIDCFLKKGIDKNKLLQWLNNLDYLEDYLINLWAPVNLNKEGVYYLKEFVMQPQENRHRYILNVLPHFYAQDRLMMDNMRGVVLENSNSYQQLFLKECANNGVYIHESLSPDLGDEKKHVYTSYADVMTALRVLSDLPGGNRHYKFCYAIRLYYSLCIHRNLIERFLFNKQNATFDFFSDVLFRQGECNNIDSNPIFWHMLFEEKTLSDAFNENQSQQLLSAKSRILRCEEKTDYNYITTIYSSNYKEEKDFVVFNPFYFLLFDVEMLFNENSENVVEVYSNSDKRAELETAMVIFLNWDVQDRIMHNFRQPNHGNAFLLEDLIERIFYSDAMNNCIKDVCKDNRLNGSLSTATEYFSCGFDDFAKDAYFNIQFSVPELRLPMCTYYINKIHEVTNALKVLISMRKGLSKNSLKNIMFETTLNLTEKSIDFYSIDVTVREIAEFIDYMISFDGDNFGKKLKKYSKINEEYMVLTINNLKRHLSEIEKIIEEIKDLSENNFAVNSQGDHEQSDIDKSSTEINTEEFES